MGFGILVRPRLTSWHLVSHLYIVSTDVLCVVGSALG